MTLFKKRLEEREEPVVDITDNETNPREREKGRGCSLMTVRWVRELRVGDFLKSTRHL